MELVGWREVEFEKNGEEIRGVRLYFTYPDDHVNGVATESIYVSDRVELPALSLGAEYDVLYNKYGKVKGIVSR